MVGGVALNALLALQEELRAVLGRLVETLQQLELLVVQVDDAEHLAVIQFLRVPGLLVISTQGFVEHGKLLVHRLIADLEHVLDFMATALPDRDDDFRV